jgi:hypothetical protein
MKTQPYFIKYESIDFFKSVQNITVLSKVVKKCESIGQSHYHITIIRIIKYKKMLQWDFTNPKSC